MLVLLPLLVHVSTTRRIEPLSCVRDGVEVIGCTDGIADRPDLVGPVTIQSRNPGCYIVDRRNAACNTTNSAFVDLPAGALRFGSAGRNILQGPGLQLHDFSVTKNTRFRERYNLQFRAEFFNIFNHTNFNQPNRTTNVAAPAFGSINSAQRPREMQFALKLEF